MLLLRALRAGLRTHLAIGVAIAMLATTLALLAPITAATPVAHLSLAAAAPSRAAALAAAEQAAH